MINKFIKIVKSNKLISAVIFVGLCATLAYAFYFQVRVAVDAKAYNSIAWSLVQGTGYTETTNPIPDAAIGRLGPGYEFFLAFWYFLFGQKLWIIWILQSFLHVASGFILYLLIKEFYHGEKREEFASLAAGIYIFFIDLLEFPAMLMTETLYMFLVLLGIYYGLRMWRGPTLKNSSLATVFLTLAILVRPPALIVLVVLLLYLLVRKHFKLVLACVVISILLLTPWTVRNYKVYNRLIVTSAILGYDIWVGNNPQSNHIGELTATKEIDKFSEEKGLFEANKRGKSEVLNLLFSHPKEFIKLQLTKTSIYFSAARPAAFWFHLTGTSQLLTIIFSSLFAYLLFIFGISGFVTQIKKRTLDSWFLVLVTLSAPAGIIWIVAETRYRYQIYPCLIILGVLFLAELYKNKKELYRVLGIVAVLVTANTLFDFIHNSTRVIERLHNLW